MDTVLLGRYMVEAASDRDQLAEQFRLKVIKDNMAYRLAQNLYRYTGPLDEEGLPQGGENMARFPSFLIRLDNLLKSYRPEDDDENEGEEDETEEEDSDHPSGKKRTEDSDDDDDDDESEDDDDDDDDESDDDDDDDDIDDDSDDNDDDDDD